MIAHCSSHTPKTAVPQLFDAVSQIPHNALRKAAKGPIVVVVTVVVTAPLTTCAASMLATARPRTQESFIAAGSPE